MFAARRLQLGFRASPHFAKCGCEDENEKEEVEGNGRFMGGSCGFPRLDSRDATPYRGPHANGVGINQPGQTPQRGVPSWDHSAQQIGALNGERTKKPS